MILTIQLTQHADTSVRLRNGEHGPDNEVVYAWDKTLLNILNIYLIIAPYYTKVKQQATTTAASSTPGYHLVRA